MKLYCSQMNIDNLKDLNSVSKSGFVTSSLKKNPAISKTHLKFFQLNCLSLVECSNVW
jgi:hypothetical protein